MIHDLIERVANGAAVSPTTDLLLEVQRYAFGQRAKAHNHSNDEGQPPVIVFDLNRTLTPAVGFDDKGFAPPYPGVADALRHLAGRGACLHLATALLAPHAGADVLASRKTQIKAWIKQYGLPISFVTGKVHADIYYDDRMVPLVNGNWRRAFPEIIRRIEARFELGEDRLWHRKSAPESGRKLPFPDPKRVPPDHPRGLVAPVIDVDMHRCLSDSSSSTRDAPPRPGAVEAMRKLYNDGFTVNISCAGWDPCTHDPEEAEKRYAGLRRWVRKNGIPFDEFISKDHGDVFVDDKGITHVNWNADTPKLESRLRLIRRTRREHLL